MTVQEREEVINSVISVLLSIEKNKMRSDAEIINDAVNRETAEMAVVRVGGSVVTAKANYSAVMLIVAATCSVIVANFAVLSCLDIYNVKKKEIFGLDANDALGAATCMLANASRDVREKTIAAVAEKGWYGRIEALARKYLNRGLTAEEVVALVDSYVNKRGMRSEEQEKNLLNMANTYAPQTVAVVQNKITQFVKEFESDWD